MGGILLPVLHLFNDGYLAAMPLLLPFISQDLGISLSVVGLLGSMLSFSGIVLALPAGMLASRFGDNRVLGCGVLLYGLGFLVLAIAQGAYSVYIVAGAFLLSSLAFGVFHPIAFSSVARNSADTHGVLGQRMGVFSATGDVGKIALATLATLLAGRFSWKTTALVYALVAIAFFVFCMVALRNQESPVHTAGAEKRMVDYSVCRNKAFRAAICAGILDTFANSSLFMFLPFLLTFRGIDSTLIASFTAVFFIGNLLGKVVIGYLIGRVGEVRMFVFSELCIAAALVLLSLATNLVCIMVLALLLGFLTKGTLPIVNTMIAETVGQKGDFEAAYSVNSLTSSIANTSAPLVFGFLAEVLGVQAIFLTCALIALCSTLPALLLKRMSGSGISC